MTTVQEEDFKIKQIEFNFVSKNKTRHDFGKALHQLAYNFLQNIDWLTLSQTGGAQSTWIMFTSRVDPLGFKIARRYFWTFPKHTQIGH